jgi:DNA-binding response OmpR family regulator
LAQPPRRIDLVITDIMMPGEDGLSLTRHVRDAYGLPVILLTARDEEVERVVGLEIGADDYIGKPFGPRELVARIRAVLRRSQAVVPPAIADDGGSERYHFGQWTLHVAEHAIVADDGETVALSIGEFQLLLALLRHPRQVMSRERLIDMVRGRDADMFDRAIDNLVSRLRRKLRDDAAAPALIKTVWGGGYRFAGDVRHVRPGPGR